MDMAMMLVMNVRVIMVQHLVVVRVLVPLSEM